MAVRLRAIGQRRSRGMAQSRRAVMDQAWTGRWCGGWAVDRGERTAASGANRDYLQWRFDGRRLMLVWAIIGDNDGG